MSDRIPLALDYQYLTRLVHLAWSLAAVERAAQGFGRQCRRRDALLPLAEACRAASLAAAACLLGSRFAEPTTEDAPDALVAIVLAMPPPSSRREFRCRFS